MAAAVERPAGEIAEAGDAAVPAPLHAAPADTSVLPQPHDSAAAAIEEPEDEPDSEMDRLKLKARRLRRDAADLREMTRRLENRAGRLERKAHDLTVQANQAEALIHVTGTGVTAEMGEGLLDDSTGRVDEGEIEHRHELLARQRELVGQLHSAADSLVHKAHAITSKVQQLEDEAERREDFADDLEDQADDLDTRSHVERFPLAFGYQNHYTTVGPHDDSELHILVLSGLSVQYAFRSYLIVAMRDLMLHFDNTVEGTRFAVSLSPTVLASLSPFRHVDVEAGAGAIVQAQAGARGDSDAAVAPFVSLATHIWVTRRVTLGPIARLGYLAYGNMQVGVLPTDRTSVMPQGTLWLDMGLALGIHF